MRGGCTDVHVTNDVHVPTCIHAARLAKCPIRLAGIPETIHTSVDAQQP